MPFLPSEGEETKLLINQQLKDVLVFHYLPVLWSRYAIPNDIREFWYRERPEILDYMQKAYKNFDIQFLPASAIREGIIKALINYQFFDSDKLLNIDYSFYELSFTQSLFKNNTILSLSDFGNSHFYNFI